MPPEPPLPPWDRRDHYSRKQHHHEHVDNRSIGQFGRWREPHAPPPHAPPPYHHRHRHHHQHQRWYSDSRSYRPATPGHGKQGGWHMHSDEAGHGFLPFGSRYGDRNFEDENCTRPYVSRSDGRSFRNVRENRGSFTNVWKAPSREPAVSPNRPGRPIIDVNYRRPVENSQKADKDGRSKSIESSSPLPSASNPLSEYQSPPTESRDKNVESADVPASTNQKVEKDNGPGQVDWKPLKWSRSGSLSSRSSILSHSSSSKSMGVDSVGILAEAELKKVMPVQSPSADVVPCVVSSAPDPADETGSRKKPRLGWGEGLAKFEKKKVEVPEGCTTRDGAVVSDSNAVTEECHAVNLLNKSPTVASFSECGSPTTSSVACSSSPGIEEKESFKLVNVDYGTTNLICSPSNMSQTHDDGATFNLETLDLATIANMSTSINELLQSEDSGYVEPGFMQNSSLNKLLVWKVEALKALEVTESEIDSLETELKSLITEHRSCCPPPDSSSSMPGECNMKTCADQVTDSQFTARPAQLQVVSSEDMIVENISVSVEDEHSLLKDKDVDSPGSATSKFVGALPAREDIFSSEAAENDANIVILNANKSSVSALRSDFADELSKLLPAKQCEFGISSATCVSSVHSDSQGVMEKFLRKKRSLQFKEKAIALKFKVFQHFWRKGRPVSVIKLRTQSHKKGDLRQTGEKKNRSSSRSRTSSYAARTVPAADEVIEFVNMLLSETPFKPYRNTLKMPALILDNDIKISRFISHNGLVKDPCAVEKERSMINPWSSEETEIFINNLAIFGKDFKKIASFLDHRTVADCIEFYYKNHKSQCFERARKKPDFFKQTKSQSITYMVASGKRRNREMNAASLDMLGAASAVAASANGGTESQQNCTSRCLFGASSSCRKSTDEYAPLQRSNSLDMYSNERETAAADVLAGICGSMSSEAMSSCITSSLDPSEGYQDLRCQRVGSASTRPLTPEVTQNVDDESSDESCGEMDPTDWTDEEKSIFIQAVSSYGKDFVMISQSVRTRSRDQCKMFFSKARKRLGLDLIHPGACNNSSDDVNEGDSDIEDACVVEAGPVICDGSECKIEDDVVPPNMKLNHESGMAATQNLKFDFKIHEENNAPCLLGPMAADIKVDHMQESGNMGVSSSIQVAPVEEEGDHHLPNSFHEAEKRDLVRVSNGHCSGENEGQGPSSPEDNLEIGRADDRDCSSMEVGDISCAVSDMRSDTYVSQPSFGAHSSMQVVKVSECQKKVDYESFSVEKSHAMPLQQNGHLASVNPSTLFTVPIKYQRSPTRYTMSAVGSNGIRNEHFHKTVGSGGSQQDQSSLSLSDPFETSHILKGYPVSVQTMNETNGVANFKRSIPLQDFTRRDGIPHSDRRTDFSIQRCNGLRHQGKMESLFPSHQEQSKDHSRPESGCSSDADKPSRYGNVKLFGKILVPSQQKPNSSVEQVDNNIQHCKAGYQSLDLKFSGDQVSIDASQSNFDRNNYNGSENIPLRSFGFRDANHIQTGFPPLSDSALLLAKYPSAFDSYSMPTLKFAQPPLHGVVKSNHHPSNGVSGFPSWDLSSNCDVPPFTIDMKQQQDVILSEMQRRKMFDLVSGQRQARGAVGIHVVGRGGILVGSQSSGVSDPVAAIKMHYANTVQMGNCIKQEDVWRNNGM